MQQGGDILRSRCQKVEGAKAVRVRLKQKSQLADLGYAGSVRLLALQPVDDDPAPQASGEPS